MDYGLYLFSATRCSTKFKIKDNKISDLLKNKFWGIDYIPGNDIQIVLHQNYSMHHRNLQGTHLHFT
jgi:hypothetical protein